MTAIDSIKMTIGNLVVENAGLSAQLSESQAKVAELEKQLPKGKEKKK